MNTKMEDQLELAIQAAIEAGKEILKVYELPEIAFELKGDNSPLTLADSAANKVINSYLEQTKHPIISEENKQLDYAIRKNWNTFWMVDPLDGTKEFIKKNGEFTVNIALCENGSPIFGVIYVPVTRELYYADVHKKQAFKTVLNENHEIPGELGLNNDRIFVSEMKNKSIRVVGSRSHMNQETTDYIEKVQQQYQEVITVSKGSSLKFCLVAEGRADVYPRFAPTMEWDTAAGHAICKAVGLTITIRDTDNELLYNKENLLNPYFLVAR